ncbi:hypothetical protein DBR45_51125 [Pseudomonas sp. HMWF031]|nr:hypothetical protein DBR45_51125 [Pseudomonas sp. HMWF031]
MPTKSIYTAIAAPGAGKTHAVINKIPGYIKHGCKIVMALPTLKLNNDIFSSMKAAKLSPRIINSEQDEVKNNQTSVTKVLTEALINGSDSLIVITHDSLRRVDPKLLQPYILIIDEVPSILDINHFTVNAWDAITIFAETDNFNNQLKIKDTKLFGIKEKVKAYKASLTNSGYATTLSVLEHKIYDAILTDNIVHYDVEDGGKVTFHIIVERSIFPQIDQARRTHILAANIDGGIFDLFAKKLGYRYKKSEFTPESPGYMCDTYIYPMLNGHWSKRKVLGNEKGDQSHIHTGTNDQIIDKIFEAALQHTPSSKLLIVQNKWGKFSERYAPSNLKAMKKIEFLKLDCRGLNCYQDSNAALLLFGGNPSPNDKKSFKMISNKHNISVASLNEAWIVQNKYEASLQALTRTAIRTRGNTSSVYFYVQDMAVANYLKSTYMTNAIIDDCLALTIEKPDGRSKTPPDEKAKAINFIKHGLNKGTRQSDINKAVMELWKVAERTARTWTKNVRESLPVKPAEGLEQFFV